MVVIWLWNRPSCSERRDVCIKSDQIKGLSLVPQPNHLSFSEVEQILVWLCRSDLSCGPCEFILCLKIVHFEPMVLPEFILCLHDRLLSDCSGLDGKLDKGTGFCPRFPFCLKGTHVSPGTQTVPLGLDQKLPEGVPSALWYRTCELEPGLTPTPPGHSPRGLSQDQTLKAHLPPQENEDGDCHPLRRPRR